MREWELLTSKLAETGVDRLEACGAARRTVKQPREASAKGRRREAQGTVF